MNNLNLFVVVLKVLIRGHGNVLNEILQYIIEVLMLRLVQVREFMYLGMMLILLLVYSIGILQKKVSVIGKMLINNTNYASNPYRS
jgi:hypothetical protein